MAEREYVSPLIRSIFKLDAETQDQLVGKYQIRRDSDETRQDVTAMLALQHTSCLVQEFINSSTAEERIFTTEIASRILQVIHNAQRGNWVLVREYLQEEGRRFMATAGPYKEMGGVDDYEKKAQAYFNMAASLGT